MILWLVEMDSMSPRRVIPSSSRASSPSRRPATFLWQNRFWLQFWSCSIRSDFLVFCTTLSTNFPYTETKRASKSMHYTSRKMRMKVDPFFEISKLRIFFVSYGRTVNQIDNKSIGIYQTDIWEEVHGNFHHNLTVIARVKTVRSSEVELRIFS